MNPTHGTKGFTLSTRDVALQFTAWSSMEAAASAFMGVPPAKAALLGVAALGMAMATLSAIDLCNGWHRPSKSRIAALGGAEAPSRAALQAPWAVVVSALTAWMYHGATGDAEGTTFLLAAGTFNVVAAAGVAATGSHGLGAGNEE